MLVGLGAVGTRVARVLAGSDSVTSLEVVHPDRGRAARLVEALGARVSLRPLRGPVFPEDADVVVVASPAAAVPAAEAALRSGAHVVTVEDDPVDVRRLLALDGAAREVGRSVVVAAAMSPGLSCVLARVAAEGLDQVQEVHVASSGTGGPACARRHHHALSSVSTDWHDGAWRRRPGGSGRELVWFPEPVGGADCYRAALAEPLLLVPAFPGVTRVTSKVHATRRDRLTAPLPMLRRPHPEGIVGAVRVEVRGWLGGRAETVQIGASGRPALVAGTVAALTALCAAQGGMVRHGAGGLAEMISEPAILARQVSERGIAVSRFYGQDSTCADDRSA